MCAQKAFLKCCQIVHDRQNIQVWVGVMSEAESGIHKQDHEGGPGG